MSDITRNQERITEVEEDEAFLMGQMAQSTGDYFALLGKYDEARGEYESALAAYEQVLFDSTNFDEAQSNQQIVLKTLGELQDKLEEEFLIGQMAQATGEYFALLRRYDEARGEYLAAIYAYEKIPPSFPNFSLAQSNKNDISVLLESLKLESSVNQRQVEDDEDTSFGAKTIKNSIDRKTYSWVLNFYAFHRLIDPMTEQEIPGALEKMVQECIDIGRKINSPELASWHLRFLENGLSSELKQQNNRFVENSHCAFNAVLDGIKIQGSIFLINLTNTHYVVDLTLTFIVDIDLTLTLDSKYSNNVSIISIIKCLDVTRFIQQKMQTSLGNKLIITIESDQENGFTEGSLRNLAHYIGSNLQSDVRSEGELFNYPVFEFYKFINNKCVNNIGLWFLDKKGLSLRKSKYYELVHVLHYQMESIRLYNQFKDYYKVAWTIYQDLEADLEKTRFGDGLYWEEAYFDFSDALVSLEHCYHAMIADHKKYYIWLKELRLCETENKELSFLDRFYEKFHNYSEQNQELLNILRSAQHGVHQRLIAVNRIDTIKERKKQRLREQRRDRNNLLALVAASSGIGTAGVAAFRSSQTNKENTIPLSSVLPYPFTTTAIFSITLGLFVAVFVGILTKLWQHYSDTKKSNKTKLSATLLPSNSSQLPPRNKGHS